MQITMPSGTTVTATHSCITTDECYLDVKVYALSEDMEHSEGLCGNFNGETDDDLVPMGSTEDDNGETDDDTTEDDNTETDDDTTEDDDTETDDDPSNEDDDNLEPIEFVWSYRSVTHFFVLIRLLMSVMGSC